MQFVSPMGWELFAGDKDFGVSSGGAVTGAPFFQSMLGEGVDA